MYKIYESNNYIIVESINPKETFYGHKKEVFIDKSNLDKPIYRIFNVRDLKDETLLEIGQIQKENGDLYSEAEFDAFYTANTGNFNGGGTAPTGGFIPLSGTTEGNPVTGNIEMIENGNTVSIKQIYGTSIDEYKEISFEDDSSLRITNSDSIQTNNITINESGISLLNTGSDFRGINCSNDVSENITDFDYTQKIYVDTQSQVSSATSGTVNLDSGKRDLAFIHEAGATTSLTLNLPTSPKNNQKVTIMSVGGIVGLTLATAVGTIVGTVTTLAALGSVKLIWNSGQNKWYRI
jgi:hypothetical protein